MADIVNIEVSGDASNFEMKENGTPSVKAVANRESPYDQGKNAKEKGLNLSYRINDVPPWHLCILLGFQHYLTMFGATLSVPLIVGPAICMGKDDVAKSELLGTILFVSGLITLLQATFGVRLPIVQGGTFAFLVPTFAILRLEKWQCPPDAPEENNSTISETTTEMSPWNSSFSPPIGTPEHRELWQSRMREIQGAIILASLFEVVIGFSGMIGILLKFIGPLAIAPTIALIGIALFPAAATFCSSHWGIALMTIFFIALFSQYLRNVNIPCASITFKGEGKGCKRAGFPLFQLFPVILAICLSWFVCAMLTIGDVLPSDNTKSGYNARTDIKLDVLYEAKWFRFPYPFQWGMPTFSPGAVFGMLAGVLAGMIESVGDYYACARLSGAPTPPVHAVNRGIFLEGVGCVLSGMWGTGTGTTSYSENIGAIGITKVGSRRVIQVGGIIILLFGLFGKFGALFVTIPDPIIGGVFTVMFGMVAAVGISNLQYVDLNSSRNLFIFGFSIVFGLALPSWLADNPGAIKTGSDVFDQILTVLFSTSMFVGGFVGLLLDNTIPGTLEERGMTMWLKQENVTTEKAEGKDTTYDLPFGMGYVRSWKWARYVPVCPTFNMDWVRCRKRNRSLRNDENATTAEVCA